MMDLLGRFNWVDVFVLALIIRIVYNSVKNGFIIELIKTASSFFAIFVAFHYYVKLAVLISRYTRLEGSPLEAATFAALWLATVLVCKFSRDGLLLLFSIETISIIDRAGAVLVAALRSVLTVSMFLFLFLLTDHPYVERMTFSSFSQKYTLSVAPKAYRKITNGFVAKLFSGQKLNAAVFEEIDPAAKKE
jgi:uncharacterized membrane protein required for colicin V production